MATINANIVNTLGAGSGVDTKSLAQSLVDAEKTPQKKLLDDKIGSAKARISGLAALMAGLNVVKKAFTDLSTPSGVNSLSVVNSQSTAFSVSTTAASSTGLNSVQVISLAKPQTSEIQFGGVGLVGKDVDLAGSLSPSTAADGSLTVSMEVTVAGKKSNLEVPVSISNTASSGYKLNLDDFAAAVNKAKVGISANVIFPGQEAGKYKLVLSGPAGASNAFSISDSGGVTLDLPSANTVGAISQEASDAQLVVDGVLYQRPSNTVSDIIAGSTLTLMAPTIGAATVQTTRDVSTLKDKVNALIKAFNDTQSDLKILAGAKNSQDATDTYSGSLQNDPTARLVSSQLRAMLTSDSGTPGVNIKRLGDIGVTVDKTGVASLDEAKFKASTEASFDEVVRTLTGIAKNSDGKLVKGVTGAALDRLSSLMAPGGILLTASTGANSDVTRYTKQLGDLDDRMSRLLERYTKQFSAMENIVGQSNSLKASLKGQFDGMLASYKN